MAPGDVCPHGGTPLTCFYCLHPAVGSFFNAGHQCNPQGWQCPSCSHVYSPAVASCAICPLALPDLGIAWRQTADLTKCMACGQSSLRDFKYCPFCGAKGVITPLAEEPGDAPA